MMTEQFVPLLLLLASLDGAAQPQQKIPRAYQGEWNMHLKDCGTSRNDSVLRLHGNQLAYFESTGPVRAAVARERELVLIAELKGEGETRLHAAHFQLARDGRSLTDLRSTPPLVRYRCPLRRN
ncbi:hypothetical protein MasN3_08410 [Massilia varians]|uniref:Uncharacterized protein n=1 Tax=Massilia varians TaxID=457921 RepID=A0ABN6T5K1_9BURK|nr:hypothetical protein [Massilia varians]BDT57347.1 hypothetical protein MasN3_08410 [Massilia varians]